MSYNIDTHLRAAGMSRGSLARSLEAIGLQVDANETAAFARTLLYTMAKIREIRYPGLKVRQLIPTNNEVPTGANAYGWHMYDWAGTARIINPSANELPMVQVAGAEIIQAIQSLGVGFGWDLQELRGAAFMGLPLQTRLATKTREAFERAVEVIGAIGDAPSGLPGLLNNSNVAILTAGVGITGAWAGGTTTSAQVLADMHTIANAPAKNSKETFAATTMVLPTAAYQYVSSTPYSTLNPTTILEVFLASNVYVKEVLSWAYLTTAGASGVTRAIAYAKTPDAVELIIPQEFEMLPPQPDNLRFKVPCHGRIGGVAFYEPMSAVYADGV